MKKIFANIICCFIPSKKMRHKIKESVKCKQMTKNIEQLSIFTDVSHKLDACIREIQYLEQLLKYSKNVSSVDPATGNMALIQKAATSILSHFAKIANKNNLKYWLDSGTLIGYLRHNKGFVPWDDDIDICMGRSDYEKMFAFLNKDFCKDGFFYQRGEITRLYYKNLHVWVDVFPMDIGDSIEPPTGDIYNKFIQTLNSIKSEIDFDYKKWQRHECPVSQTYLNRCYNRRDKELIKKVHPCGFVFYGVETNVRTRTLYKNDVIFPLKPIKFYGIDTYIPNKPNEYLFQMYGDYMNWPKSFSSYHGISLSENMSYEAYMLCQELIKGYYPKQLKGNSL